MSLLDELIIYSDPSAAKMLRYIKEFPDLLKQSFDLSTSDFVTGKAGIKKIYFAGMGGSKLPGVLAQTLLKEYNINSELIDSYYHPDKLSSKDLVIITSYSGNTREAIFILESLLGASCPCKIIILTSGGELMELAVKHKLPLAAIPAGYPPRMAFPAMLGMIISIINQLYSDILLDDYNETLEIIPGVIKELDIQITYTQNPAKQLAKKILNKNCIIYGIDDFTTPAATRFKTQINENMKNHCFLSHLPESAHNELAGWLRQTEPSAKNNLMPIFIAARELPAELRHTLDIFQELVTTKSEPLRILGEGISLMAQNISLIILADFISYYGALLNRVDPLQIDILDYFKQELKKRRLRQKGKIVSVNISQRKGTPKRPVRAIRVKENCGIINDAHFRTEKQISLLTAEEVLKMKQKTQLDIGYGSFAENIDTGNLDLSGAVIGQRLQISNQVLLEVTHIGKECHHGCEIRKTAGYCIMPTQGIFCKVIKGGIISPGDSIELIFRES